MKRRRFKKSDPGIALFIVLSSIMILSIAIAELIQMTNNQKTRVMNYGDRLQAVYLARSALSLSRFFIIYDEFLDKKASQDGPIDTNDDFWAKPIPFPVPMELVQALQEAGGEKKESPDTSQNSEDKVKKCKSFFDDFPGEAIANVEDYSARLNLNDLDEPTNLVTEAFTGLLSPNIEFLQDLQQKRLTPEQIARELRDYMDKDDFENETKASESSPYNSANLDLGPKNRPFTSIDEIKMIPSIDDELFDYLSPHVRAVYIANSKKPAKINLNTVSQTVFQALLKNVSNPEELAAEFVKDRKEKKREYRDKDMATVLPSVLGIPPENIRLALLSGVSESFLVNIDSTVNEVKLRLQVIVSRISRGKIRNPIVQIRISP